MPTRQLEYWTFKDLDGFLAGGRDPSTSLGMTELGAAPLPRTMAVARPAGCRRYEACQNGNGLRNSQAIVTSVTAIEVAGRLL